MSQEITMLNSRTLSGIVLIALAFFCHDFALADVPVNSCSDVYGPPASATYIPNLPLNDTFSGDLEARYSLSGSPIPVLATAYETFNTLVLDTGETEAISEYENRFELADNRVIYPNQDFSISTKLAIHPSSKGNFQGGLVLFDNARRNESSMLFGIRQYVSGIDMEPPTRSMISHGPESSYDSEAVSLSDSQFITIELNYDSSLGILSVSSPDFGYSRLYNVSSFTSGFSIGFSASAYTGFDGLNYSPSRLAINFRELNSDLFSDVFAVSNSPHTLASTNLVYDQTFPGLLAQHGTLWAEDFSNTAYFASVSQTVMSLSGSQDLNLYLFNFLGRRITALSAISSNDLAAFLAANGGGIDAFIPNVLKAHGAADYEWVCPVIVVEPVNLASLSPLIATGGSLVTLLGDGFGHTQGGSSVSIGDQVAPVVLWTNTEIRIKIPSDLTANNLLVSVTISRGFEPNQISNVIPITIYPTLSTITPTSGYNGGTLSFTGSNFGINQLGSLFTLGGLPLQIISWSQTSITAQVPLALQAGVVNAMLTVNGQSSNLLSFNLFQRELLFLSSLSLSRATGGNLVTLTGIGFGGSQGRSWVSIGNVATRIVSWSDSAISFVIPNVLNSGNLLVSVVAIRASEGAQTSNNLPITIYPSLLSVAPASGFDETTVVFAGSNFGLTQSNSLFTIGGLPLEIVSWGHISVTAKIPSALQAGHSLSVITVNGQSSNTVTFTLHPHLNLIYPVEGRSQDILSLYGTSFGTPTSTGTLPAGSFVNVGGENAEIIAWSENEIQVFIPANASPGKKAVSLTVNQVTSNVVLIQIKTGNNPIQACSQHYGKMLGNLQVLSRETDNMTPIVSLFLTGAMNNNQQAIDAANSAALDTNIPLLFTGVETIRELAMHADWVLDNDCYKWIPISKQPTDSSRSPQATFISNFVVAGAVCSTRAIQNATPRSCGYFPNGLPIALENSPFAIFLGPDAIEALLEAGVDSASFAKSTLYGEWGRGEAALLSAWAHSILAFLDLVAGIQTGTVATEEFLLTQQIRPGVKRLRAHGKVIAKDRGYLAPDPAHVDALSDVPSEISLALLRMSQVIPEFESDLGDRSNDFIVFSDNDHDGEAGPDDTFSINTTVSTLKVHGLAIGRVLNVLAYWETEGIRSLSRVFSDPKVSLKVPKDVTNAKLVGISKAMLTLSNAFRSVNDPTFDDTISSFELGRILNESGIMKNAPRGLFKIKVRRIFELVQTQGLRPFLPRVIADESGETVLSVENEIFGNVAAALHNHDMKQGDSVHFDSEATRIPMDCETPGQTSGKPRQLFYYDFADPSFGGALEMSGSAFGDACTPPSSEGPATNFLVNKWLATAGVPVSLTIAQTISLSENHAVNSLRAMLVGVGPAFANTRAVISSAEKIVEIQDPILNLCRQGACK